MMGRENEERKKKYFFDTLGLVSDMKICKKKNKRDGVSKSMYKKIITKNNANKLVLCKRALSERKKKLAEE